MDPNFNNENDPWKFGLDINDSDLHLTPVLRSSSSTRVEPSPLTPNPVRIIPDPAGIVQLSSSTRVEPSPSTPNLVRIIPGPAGIVQQAKLLKENIFILDSNGALMSTQEYMQKVVEDVGEDDDFKSGAWISATNYVTATGGIVTGFLFSECDWRSHNDYERSLRRNTRNNTLIIGDGGYGKDITVGATMILTNVSVITLKPSKHYLNITKRNVVKVFRRRREKADVAPESAGRDPLSQWAA
ncbi:zf-CCHC domain-containing protein [Tanacetum coccineum]